MFIFPSLTPRNDRGLTRLLTPIDRLSPVEGMALVASDHFAAGLAYMQVVEGSRPDLAVVVRQHVMYASSVGPVRRRLPHTLERWQPGSRLQDLAHLKDGWPILWEWNLGLDQQVRPRDLTPFFPCFVGVSAAFLQTIKTRFEG